MTIDSPPDELAGFPRRRCVMADTHHNNRPRRCYDRAGSVITAAMIAAFLFGAPAAAFAAGHWTDASGRLTGPPLRQATAVDRGVAAAVLAALILGLLLLGAGTLAHRALTRR